MKASNNSKKRVLVVEDEPSIEQMCLRILSNEGLDVDIAANGKLAQNMVAEKQYNACLLDINMPELNGREFYDWLKKTHSQLARKVIFTSGDTMGGDTKDFMERTGQPFLAKPFGCDELVTIIRSLLK